MSCLAAHHDFPECPHPVPDNSAEIANLKALMNAGASTVTVDGQTTAFDLDAARRRVAEPEATNTGSGYRRPKHATRDLQTAGP